MPLEHALRLSARRLLIVGVAFLAVGLTGAFRYVQSYWLYRGFPPPSEPRVVRTSSRPAGGSSSRSSPVPVLQGTVQEISFRSPAIDAIQRAYVYLPPTYASDPHRRFPVLYLLHGVPGVAQSFLLVGRVAVAEDVLLAEGRMSPLILVMPFGPPGVTTDTEWANGVRPKTAWDTAVARDLVGAIDRRYRTIRSAGGRGIGGLSEGGYGAINIALHHPGEFGLVESWSGYELAFDAPSVFGTSKVALAYNSPLKYLPVVGEATRRARTHFWLYSGADDRLLGQNERFASLLRAFRIPNHFFAVPGSRHTWALWRKLTPTALLTASEALAHG